MKQKVFLAITDPEILRPMENILGKLGISCEWDFKVVVQDDIAGFILKKECDFIIIDICLVVNGIEHYYGLEIAHELKKRNPEKLVIGVTCHASDLKQEAKQALMDGLIHFDPQRPSITNLHSMFRAELGDWPERIEGNPISDRIPVCRNIVEFILNRV